METNLLTSGLTPTYTYEWRKWAGYWRNITPNPNLPTSIT